MFQEQAGSMAAMEPGRALPTTQSLLTTPARPGRRMQSLSNTVANGQGAMGSGLPHGRIPARAPPQVHPSMPPTGRSLMGWLAVEQPERDPAGGILARLFEFRLTRLSRRRRLQLDPGPRPCATGVSGRTSCTSAPGSLGLRVTAQAWRWAASGGQVVLIRPRPGHPLKRTAFARIFSVQISAFKGE